MRPAPSKTDETLEKRFTGRMIAKHLPLALPTELRAHRKGAGPGRTRTCDPVVRDRCSSTGIRLEISLFLLSFQQDGDKIGKTRLSLSGSESNRYSQCSPTGIPLNLVTPSFPRQASSASAARGSSYELFSHPCGSPVKPGTCAIYTVLKQKAGATSDCETSQVSIDVVPQAFAPALYTPFYLTLGSARFREPNNQHALRLWQTPPAYRTPRR